MNDCGKSAMPPRFSEHGYGRGEQERRGVQTAAHQHVAFLVSQAGSGLAFGQERLPLRDSLHQHTGTIILYHTDASICRQRKKKNTFN